MHRQTLAEQSESISHEPLFFLFPSVLFSTATLRFTMQRVSLPFLIKRNGISVPAVVALVVVVVCEPTGSRHPSILHVQIALAYAMLGSRTTGSGVSVFPQLEPTRSL